MRPIAEGAETFGKLPGIDFPSACVEPFPFALPGLHVAGIPCLAARAGVAPTEVRMNSSVQKLLHSRDVIFSAINLDLSDRFLGFPIHAGHVVRNVPTPPKVLRSHEVLVLGEEKCGQRGADFFTRLEIQTRRILPRDDPQAVA